MVIRRGEIWWADLDEPIGSAPGYRRPVLVLQSEWANESRLQTVTAAPLTSNQALANFPGNLLLEPRDSGLSMPSVVIISQITTFDRTLLDQRAGQLSPSLMRRVEDGIRLFLDL